VQPQLIRKWYTVAEVAEMLDFGVSKTKMLVAMREIRSVKIGGHRRILPEWVDEYVRTIVDADGESPVVNAPTPKARSTAAKTVCTSPTYG
jgi:excisionase family DNA binding protein